MRSQHPAMQGLDQRGDCPDLRFIRINLAVVLRARFYRGKGRSKLDSLSYHVLSEISNIQP